MKRNLWCLALFIVTGFSNFAPAEGDPVLTPAQIIRKAIDARGGEEALSKLRAHRVSLKGYMFHDKMKAPVKIDALYRRNPPSYRLNLVIDPPDADLITETVVFNGRKIWHKRNGVTREFSDVELEQARVGVLYNSEIQLLFPVLDKHRFTLHALPSIKINDSPAIGVRVASQGYPDISWYFDKKTLLLVKNKYRYKDKIHEELFEGFKRVKYGKYDILFAAKKSILVNEKKQLELELVDVDPLPEVKDSEFSRP